MIDRFPVSGFLHKDAMVRLNGILSGGGIVFPIHVAIGPIKAQAFSQIDDGSINVVHAHPTLAAYRNTTAV